MQSKTLAVLVFEGNSFGRLKLDRARQWDFIDTNPIVLLPGRAAGRGQHCLITLSFPVLH